MIKQIKRFGLVAAAGLLLTSTTVFTSLALENEVVMEGQGSEKDSPDNDASEKGSEAQKDNSQREELEDGNTSEKDSAANSDKELQDKKGENDKSGTSKDAEDASGNSSSGSAESESKETAESGFDVKTEDDAEGKHSEETGKDSAKDETDAEESDSAEGGKKKEADETDEANTDPDGNVEVKEEGKTAGAETEELTGEEAAQKTAAEAEAIQKQQETVKKEEMKAETGEYLTAEDIAGTWKIDSVTSYRFEEDGKGALILPEHTYKFRFTLKEDVLKLNFDSGKARDASFNVSVMDGVMTLECVDEGYENEYILERE